MTDWENFTELWEYQIHPLTAGQLNLGHPDFADLPILVAVYDGTGERTVCVPAEIGYVGNGDRPDAVVITVIPRDAEPS
jgi:hypothetical protein